MNILAKAGALGREALDANSALSRLAMDAARAVVSGEVDPSDAQRIYLAYYDARVIRSKAQPASSRKAQVSKLRQVMKLAEGRKDGLKLLERVVALHTGNASRPAAVWALYRCLVDVARETTQASQAADQRRDTCPHGEARVVGTSRRTCRRLPSQSLAPLNAELPQESLTRNHPGTGY
jgi:hypothetical protein